MSTILLVDDEKLERDFLKQALNTNDHSYQVVGEAINGREAIDLALQLLPNFILMDIKMPGIDGLEAIKQIKSIHPEISCIILTAYEEFSYAQKALRVGADEYLLKPVSPNDIFSVLSLLKRQNKNAAKGYFTPLTENHLISNKYPRTKEKLLLLALKNCDVKLFSSTFEEFSKELLKISTTVEALKNYLLELNTLLSRALLDSGVENQQVAAHAQNNVHAITVINSNDTAKIYFASYKNQIVNLIMYDNINNQDLVENILNYMQTNISNKNISLEELSNHFHFSTSHISRLIKKETGITFSEHLNQMRLTEAKTLLRNSTLNICKIATLVGYNEVPHFNRMFKKTFGISPSKYRKLFSE